MYNLLIYRYLYTIINEKISFGCSIGLPIFNRHSILVVVVSSSYLIINFK